jgi:protein involved in polysaccharide export with SLBB domain
MFKMKRVIVHPLGVLLCLTALGQIVWAADQPAREAAGFSTLASAVTAGSPSTTNAAIAPVASRVIPGAYVLDDKRKLLPGDRVSFQIVEDRTNAIPLLVAESSELDIPYIGRINVAGKTCKELANEIKMLLEQDYYYQATVIIGLDALAKVLGKVYVWGPVRTQGPIEIPANETFTAGKAILRAGGFGDFANRKEVKIVRKTPTGNVTLKVNMVEVLEKGHTDQDIPLEPEDFIIVPQRAVNW